MLSIIIIETEMSLLPPKRKKFVFVIQQPVRIGGSVCQTHLLYSGLNSWNTALSMGLNTLHIQQSQAMHNIYTTFCKQQQGIEASTTVTFSVTALL